MKLLYVCFTINEFVFKIVKAVVDFLIGWLGVTQKQIEYGFIVLFTIYNVLMFEHTFWNTFAAGFLALGLYAMATRNSEYRRLERFMPFSVVWLSGITVVNSFMMVVSVYHKHLVDAGYYLFMLFGCFLISLPDTDTTPGERIKSLISKFNISPMPTMEGI